MLLIRRPSQKLNELTSFTGSDYCLDLILGGIFEVISILMQKDTSGIGIIVRVLGVLDLALQIRCEIWKINKSRLKSVRTFCSRSSQEAEASFALGLADFQDKLYFLKPLEKLNKCFRILGSKQCHTSAVKF